MCFHLTCASVVCRYSVVTACRSLSSDQYTGGRQRKYQHARMYTPSMHTFIKPACTHLHTQHACIYPTSRHAFTHPACMHLPTQHACIYPTSMHTLTHPNEGTLEPLYYGHPQNWTRSDLNVEVTVLQRVLCTVDYNLGLSNGDRNGEVTLLPLTREVTVRRGTTVLSELYTHHNCALTDIMHRSTLYNL